MVGSHPKLCDHDQYESIKLILLNAEKNVNSLFLQYYNKRKRQDRRWLYYHVNLDRNGEITEEANTQLLDIFQPVRASAITTEERENLRRDWVKRRKGLCESAIEALKRLKKERAAIKTRTGEILEVEDWWGKEEVEIKQREDVQMASNEEIDRVLEDLDKFELDAIDPDAEMDTD